MLTFSRLSVRSRREPDGLELEAEAMEAVATRRETMVSFIVLFVGNVDGDSLVAIRECFRLDRDLK